METTPEITAKEIYVSFNRIKMSPSVHRQHERALLHSINCVQRILCANPHSIPLNNVEVTSTFDFWNEVMNCLKKM